MKAVRVRISAELFLEAFPFPDGTVLEDVKMRLDFRELEVIVSHPDLPDGVPDQDMLLVTPTFRRATFADWNLP